MMRFARDVRLIPIVLVATICLFALKVSGLVFDGGYTLADRMANRDKSGMQIVSADSVPAYPKIVVVDAQPTTDTAPAEPKQTLKQSWAQEMFNFNDANKGDVTGSVGGEEKASGPPLKTTTKPPDVPKLEVGNTTVQMEPGRIASAGERAVLERLRERSQELDARQRELDMRESLIKAAEKRLEAKVTELKDTEQRINTAVGDRDKAEVARFKGIVAMYENMKAKDAARIFDRLDMKILVDVSTQMNPRKMSDILAQMSPDSAERLTVELAARAGTQKTPGVDQLPKIEGKPSGS
jgi:flagellar motility protein MotE (MotC chaperone)